MCQGEDARWERAPCHGPPSGAMFHPIQGGNGLSTGPHVPSNPMHDLNVPRAKGKTPAGSAPLVMGPQAGPCSIQFRGGMGAERAPMCPLIPCMTPTPHVPRGRRPMGARPLSWAPKRGHVQSIPGGGRGVVRAPKCALTPCMTPTPHVPGGRARWERAPCHGPPSGAMFHPIQGGNGCSTGPHVPSNPMHDPIAPRAKDTTNRGIAPPVFARHHSDCIPLLLCLALALAFTAPFLGRRRCGVQNLIQWKVCGIRCWHKPGVGPTLHAHGQWDLGALRVLYIISMDVG